MKLFAPAKVNLALHVTGKRADGYHLLDSLVVFADIGDRVTVAPADALSLRVTGPRADGVPGDARNLVWQAAQALDANRGAAITLDKHLPHAGGIGGGSSDAAATLRGLSAIWGIAPPDAAAVLALGADVPVCLHGRPCRMRGIGEVIDPVPKLPALWIVLVNPGVEVPTGPVFKTLQSVDNPALPAPAWTDAASLLHWLCGARNDLEPPARALVPQIGTVLDHLNAQPGCGLARMSGSGGTCFGLFTHPGAAHDAARVLAGVSPDWWVADAQVLRDAPDQTSRATT